MNLLKNKGYKMKVIKGNKKPTKKQMEKIYLDYSEKVTRYVRSKLFNQQKVDDLVHQVFMKIFSKLDMYDKNKASLSTWIYIITSNTVTDYCRKHKRVNFSLFDPDEGGKTHDALIEDDTYDQIFTNVTLEVLADALKQLDERQRELIVLRYYKSEKLKTIANMMKMSYSNAKIVHKQALEKLQNLMKIQLS